METYSQNDMFNTKLNQDEGLKALVESYLPPLIISKKTATKFIPISYSPSERLKGNDEVAVAYDPRIDTVYITSGHHPDIADVIFGSTD